MFESPSGSGYGTGLLAAGRLTGNRHPLPADNSTAELRLTTVIVG